MLKCIDLNKRKHLFGMGVLASRRLSLFGRVPYVLKYVDVNVKQNTDFGCFLWPRGVSDGLGGFLTCSNSEIFITHFNLDCFCGLEAPQPVWTGSLSAQMHFFK